MYSRGAGRFRLGWRPGSIPAELVTMRVEAMWRERNVELI